MNLKDKLNISDHFHLNLAFSTFNFQLIQSFLHVKSTSFPYLEAKRQIHNSFVFENVFVFNGNRSKD
jgi:hypothetical protein